MKIKTDARTLERQLREQSGIEYCTYKDVETVTGMTHKQAARRMSVLEPLPGTKPRRYYVCHVAQVLAGN